MRGKVFTKGQVLSPRPVRAQRHLVADDALEVQLPEDSPDIILRKVKRVSNQGLIATLKKLRIPEIPSRRREYARLPRE